jgi:predicted TIM-barrel fold metal-dependent hydrolase
MIDGLQIIDSQVHAYERDHPGRPWAAVLAGPAEVTGDDMVAAMDAVGVDGALLTSPFTMYRFDASYVVEQQAKHPGRFALVKPVDPADPAVGDVVTDWAAMPGVVAARLMMWNDEPGADHSGVHRVLETAGRLDLPVNIICWGRLDEAATLAAGHPQTQIVIDHLGLHHPFVPPAIEAPWTALPKLLALAQYDNVAVKVSGVGTLSRQPFPYDDLWEPLGRVFEAFGLDRCMWGSDWTRALHFLTYEQAVESFRLTDRLSAPERAALMGGTLSRIYRWAPEVGHVDSSGLAS